MSKNSSSLLSVLLSSTDDRCVANDKKYINDPDSNGDGIIDCRPRDSDGDGIPDHLDPDDDNDGIPDYLDPDSMAFLLYKRTQQMDALPVETIIHTIQHQLMPINIMLYPNGLVLPDKDEFVPMEG